MYTFNMTREAIATLQHVGGRYGWSDEWPFAYEVGEDTCEEHEIWEWADAVEADTEGGHSPFPMLDTSSDFGQAVLALYESIV